MLVFPAYKNGSASVLHLHLLNSLVVPLLLVRSWSREGANFYPPNGVPELKFSVINVINYSLKIQCMQFYGIGQSPSINGPWAGSGFRFTRKTQPNKPFKTFVYGGCLNWATHLHNGESFYSAPKQKVAYTNSTWVFAGAGKWPKDSGSASTSTESPASPAYLPNIIQYTPATATTATRQGISNETLRILGRWSSQGYRPYIRNNLNNIRRAQANQGSHEPMGSSLLGSV